MDSSKSKINKNRTKIRGRDTKNYIDKYNSLVKNWCFTFHASKIIYRGLVQKVSIIFALILAPCMC